MLTFKNHVHTYYHRPDVNHILQAGRRLKVEATSNILFGDFTYQVSLTRYLCLHKQTTTTTTTKNWKKWWRLFRAYEDFWT